MCLVLSLGRSGRATPGGITDVGQCFSLGRTNRQMVMPVRNLAVDAVTARQDASVSDLAQTMGDEDIGDLVVVEDEKPIGIVTDRDIALAVGEHNDLSSTTAADLMTENPATIQGDADSIELPRKLGEEKIRRLPVVDDDGRLQGVVTLDDVVATIGEELDNVSTVIEAQSPGYSPSPDQEA